MFYETEGLKYQTQIHVKSTRGQNAKGSKITGIQAAYWPPGSDRGEVKLLISSNDSRIRLYNLRDKSLEIKFRGHENSCSQIRASFADDTGNIVCGSEDRKTYIWSTGAPEGERRNQRPVEMFEAHNSITTCAVMAPLKTRLLLAASEDPIFDLCNPPPVTLVSRAESVASSRPATDGGSAMPTPATDTGFKRVAETPAYLARSAHKDGNIIVTADYTGAIKVFRQDCAYTKRLRVADNWDASSVFSKRTGSKIGRPSSLFSKAPSSRPRRDSTSTQPADDRIMSWRQDISHGSFDSASVAGSIPTPRRSQARSRSPRKSRLSVSSANARPVQIVDRDTPALVPALTNESGKPASAPPGLLPAEPSLKTSSSMERMSSARASDDVDVSVSGESSSAAAATPAVETEVEVETQGKRERTRPGQLHIHTGSDIGMQSQTQVTTLNKASTNSSFFQAPLSGAAQTPRSWAFWNRTPTVPGFPGSKRERERAEGDMRAATGLGRSSSQAGSEEEEEVEEEEEEEDGVVCRACGADEFRVRLVKSGVSGSVGASGSVSSGPREERKLVCGRCGVLAG
jgi:WD40 repeat protein